MLCAAARHVNRGVDAPRRRRGDSDRISGVRDLPERFNAAAFFVDRHVAEGRGGRTAFRAAGRSIGYAELAERVDRAASALASRGVELEHRVLLVLDDTPAFAAAFWGAVKLGAVAVPVNTLMTDAEYEFLLNDSRARAVLAEDAIAARLRALGGRCPWLRAVLAPGDLEREAGARVEPAATSREDVMYWGYTSGSTGRPKAAVHTHQNFVRAAELVGSGVFGIGPDDLTYSASKLYFAFGLGNALYFPALAGAASVLVPERTTPERAFEVIAAERPTIFFAVPTLYARMLQPRRSTTSSRTGRARRGAAPPARSSRGSRRGSWTTRAGPSGPASPATSSSRGRRRRPSTGTASTGRARRCSASGSGRATCSSRTRTAGSRSQAGRTTW